MEIVTTYVQVPHVMKPWRLVRRFERASFKRERDINKRFDIFY
ncbi:hypothetical protein KOR42_09480 [Thalassoglobus neptunius]|uniref:Uncharacterized protein n=1 Tax=Thalassoglobus neptunius TaxID=1938619 RepID=A0A5C5X3Q4_9PLAN|nr:hypothetical protein KOR42_09480 [Thalassoglobus neptunius]